MRSAGSRSSREALRAIAETCPAPPPPAHKQHSTDSAILASNHSMLCILPLKQTQAPLLTCLKRFPARYSKNAFGLDNAGCLVSPGVRGLGLTCEAGSPVRSKIPFFLKGSHLVQTTAREPAHVDYSAAFSSVSSSSLRSIAVVVAAAHALRS